MSTSDGYVLSNSFNDTAGFSGPCKNIASVSLECVRQSSTLQDVSFINKSELVFGHRIGSGSFGKVLKGLLYNQDVAVKCFTVDNAVTRLNKAMHGSTDAFGASEQPFEERTKVQASILSDVIVCLEREVAVLKRLHSSSIVRFIGICLDPAAIVTDYCARGSLFDLIKKCRKSPDCLAEFTWERRLKIALDAATGMEHLHFNQTCQVLHGDLKSPNLLVDENYNGYIADFNTARFITCDIMKASLVANNPYWLAPEVYIKEKFAKSVDVYPFGIILWELMTLMLPFEKENGDVVPMWTVAMSVSLKNARPVIIPNSRLIGGECPVYDKYCKLMKECWDRDEQKRPDYKRVGKKLKKMLDKVKRQTKHVQQDSFLSVDSAGSSKSFHRTSCMSDAELQKEVGNLYALGNDDSFHPKKFGLVRKLPSPSVRDTSCASDKLPVTQTNEKKAETPFAVPPVLSPSSSADIATSPSLVERHAKLIPFRGKSLEAQRRWQAIKSVIRLIIDQRQFPKKASTKQETTEKQDNDDCKQEVAEALVNSEDGPKTDETTKDNSPTKTAGWGFLRQMVVAEMGPSIHPGWDILSGKNLARLKALQSETLQKLDRAASIDDKTQGKNTGSGWVIAKHAFFDKDGATPPQVPASWKNLLEMISPCSNETSEVKEQSVPEEPVDVRAIIEEKSKSSNDASDETGVWSMLLRQGSIVERHWEFLSGFVQHALGQSTSANSDTLTGRMKPLKEMMIVDDTTPSEAKWTFFREWIIDGGLPEEWNALIAFVQNTKDPPNDVDWYKFRKLFFEDRNIRQHDDWGFLKDLFLTDGRLSN